MHYYIIVEVDMCMHMGAKRKAIGSKTGAVREVRRMSCRGQGGGPWCAKALH